MNSKSGIPGKSFKFLLLIISLISVRMIFYYAVTDFTVIISRVPDDASYYLKIAQNFNEGYGFTFDGISRTSGFQPLWQYILIIFTFVFKASPETTMRAVMILQVLILYISSLIFIKILRNIFTYEIVFAGGLIFTVFVYFQYLNGMETPLMILIFLFLFYYALRSRIFVSRKTGSEFITGILIGLLMLARLDTVFISTAIFGICIAKILTGEKEKRSEGIKCFLIILSGTLIITLPYLIFNFIYTGNIIPISGYLKSTVSGSGFSESTFQVFKYREMFFGLLSILYLIIYFKNFKKYRVTPFAAGMAVMAAGNILLMIYIIFFMKWVIFPWYFTPFSIFFSFFICLIFKYILSVNYLNSGKLIFKILSAVIILYWGAKVFNMYVLDSGIRSEWNVESYKASQWALQKTERSDIFAMKDAGHFSYFSNRQVINLDGLVNSFEFQEILKDKNLNNYFKDNSVKYIVQHAVWNRDDITDGEYESTELNFISHKYSLISDNITVHKKDEAYRSEPYFDGEYRTVFLIWNYQNNADEKN